MVCGVCVVCVVVVCVCGVCVCVCVWEHRIRHVSMQINVLIIQGM